ncbi:TIM-barrel domain-containing protein [Colwellia sp. D2M02]|uniref:glycoside hydrolase family 31 protein n=1 Tax=Colwellia sp. D2M02 TaxID=2841562 RepID=UPI00339D6E42
MRSLLFKNLSLCLLSVLCILTSGSVNEVLASESLNNNHYLSHEIKNNSLVINTKLGRVSLSNYSGAVEVVYQIEQSKFPAQQLPSFAIKEQAPKSSFSTKDSQEQLTFTTKQLTAVIQKSPFAIRYYQQNNQQPSKLLLAEESGYFSGSVKENEQNIAVQGFRFHLDDTEKLLGGGERVLGMNRRGHAMPLYNKAHYGYTTESSQMNFGLPAVMSSNKYIVLFDNSAKGYLDLANAEQNIMQFSAVSGRMAYLVFAGETYPELINNYVNVTGKQPLPARWTLGNFASRFGYRNEQQVRGTVKKFVDLDIPLDALVLDLYWFGKDIKGHMGNLAWDKDTFPTPQKMMIDIKAQGVKTVLITEPFVLTTSSKWQEASEQQALAKNADGGPKRFDFYFGNTGLVDVFSNQGQQWFNNIYTDLYQQGVTGWWGDLGEPEVHPSDTLHTLSDNSVVNGDAIHNAYGHQWAKMVYNNQLAINPNERPFILMRSGFSGSQRYGMIPWTGDVSRSWGGLKPQVELSLQMGILGMAYTHSDLGGFAGGESFDKQLYIRWLQYGVFQPIYRPHAQDNIAAEVVFHDKNTQDILRKFIKLRYQLLPYNYSLAYQNSRTGMPLMRPLFFEDEADISLIDNKHSYLWGDAFLVTPVVNPDVKHIEVDLPAGVWFEYFPAEHKPSPKYQGKQTITLATDINTLPVLVRAGSFIPMVDAIQSTEDYQHSRLNLHYYADSSVTSARYEMYEDDGKTAHAMDKGLFELLQFEAEQKAQKLTIKLSRKNQLNSLNSSLNKINSGFGYQGMPQERIITMVIHNWQKPPTAIHLNNSAITNSVWHEKNKTLTVKFSWQHQPATLTLL